MKSWIYWNLYGMKLLNCDSMMDGDYKADSKQVVVTLRKKRHFTANLEYASWFFLKIKAYINLNKSICGLVTAK